VEAWGLSPTKKRNALIRHRLRRILAQVVASALRSTPAMPAPATGTHAVSLDVTLVTNNEREFRRIPSLAVENWAK